MSRVDRDELYAVAPDRFVPERDALAKELRAAGKRDEAGEVAALRKPSVAARAVNRLAREHPRELDALLAAGDDLIDVQSRVVAGDADAGDLARAAERERAAVSDLVRTAGELLAAEGLKPSSAVLERVSETLHAAALDAQARPPVQEGRLERELRHIGFWTGGSDSAAQARAPRAATSAKKAPASQKRTKVQADAEAAAARQREAARKDAQTAVTDARRVAARASRAADSAERRRAGAAESLGRAERADREAAQALAASRQAAQEAAAALEAAERELRALSDD
jgi:hypothetical protein